MRDFFLPFFPDNGSRHGGRRRSRTRELGGRGRGRDSENRGGCPEKDKERRRRPGFFVVHMSGGGHDDLEISRAVKTD